MKVARTVLRGERGSNAPDLLDHHRLLHHSDGGGLDHPSRGHGRLRAQREPDGGTRRKHGGQRGRRHRRQRRGTHRQAAEIEA